MKILTTLALAGGAMFLPARVEAEPVQCDVVVQLGDSATSKDPQPYVDAYLPAGFDMTLVVAGSGRMILGPDVRDDDLAGWRDGERSGVEYLRSHRTGVESVHDLRILFKWAGVAHPCWVVALGSNDAAHLTLDWWQYDIDQMVAALDGDPAIWVTAWADAVWPGYTPEVMGAWNAFVASQLPVCDWASTVVDRPDLFLDGAHPTHEGHLQRASFLAGCAQATFT